MANPEKVQQMLDATGEALVKAQRAVNAALVQVRDSMSPEVQRKIDRCLPGPARQKPRKV